jgi:hypothetical protein
MISRTLASYGKYFQNSHKCILNINSGFFSQKPSVITMATLCK